MTGEDFAAENYHARHDGTNALDELDRAEIARWKRTVIGQAGLNGVPVTTSWALCWCQDGDHHPLRRYEHIDSLDHARFILAGWVVRGKDAHPIRMTTTTVTTGWEDAE